MTAAHHFALSLWHLCIVIVTTGGAVVSGITDAGWPVILIVSSALSACFSGSHLYFGLTLVLPADAEARR